MVLSVVCWVAWGGGALSVIQQLFCIVSSPQQRKLMTWSYMPDLLLAWMREKCARCYRWYLRPLFDRHDRHMFCHAPACSYS